MAVQLILKNSAVQDKEATAAQLATGELALNYYESGPFLQCKDTAGNIWRLGGVVIASTAPSSPSKGAWWLDSDDNHLYFYNGSSWVEVQTGEITASDIAEGTARQLLQTNAAGTATEWTSNIDVPGTLDVTGVATFDNNVVIEGNLTVNGTTTTIDTETLLVEDKNIEMGVVTTPTDLTADGGGITLKGATDKTINWVNATDAWTSSERFSVPLGAQGTPSLTFTGDPNTGIYSPGADQVAISTGGTGRLFVDASGNVGVKAPAAGALFSVGTTNSSSVNSTIASSTTGDGGLYFYDGGNAGAIIYNHATNYLQFRVNSAERLRIDSSGRVGIGTSTVDSLLHLVKSDATTYNATAADGQVGVGPTIYLENPANLNTTVGGQIVFGMRSTEEQARIGATGGTAPALTFGTGDAERMRLTSTGLGVGTTSPSYALDVKQSSTGNSNTVAAKGGTNGGGYFWETNAGTTYGAIGYGDLISANSGSSNTAITSWGAQDLLLGTNRTERVRIDSSGRVGIGVSSPGSYNSNANTLVVGNTSSNQGITISAGTASASAIHFADGTTGDESYRGILKYEHSNDRFLFGTAGGNTALTIDSSQRVGIGTTSPNAILEVVAASSQRHLRVVTHSSGDSCLQSVYPDNGNLRTISLEGSTVDFYTATGTDTTGTLKGRFDSSGRLLVGTSSTSNAYTSILAQGNASGANTDALLRLATENSSPANGAGLGGVLFCASNHGDTAAIRAFRDGGTWTNDSSEPTRLVFSTTADGASSPTERVRIEATGKTKFSGAAYGVENTITASAFDLNSGNLWTCGAIAIPNPTNAVAGLMGSIRVTAAPTSFGSNFDHPGGSYTAPTSFPAVAPFYCVSSTNILLGSWTQGIA